MPEPVAAEPQLARELGLRDLVLFLIPVRLRAHAGWPTAASAGSGTVTLWLGDGADLRRAAAASPSQH
jgi:hypothetical protein